MHQNAELENLIFSNTSDVSLILTWLVICVCDVFQWSVKMCVNKNSKKDNKHKEERQEHILDLYCSCRKVSGISQPSSNGCMHYTWTAHLNILIESVATCIRQHMLLYVLRTLLYTQHKICVSLPKFMEKFIIYLRNINAKYRR